MPTKVLHVLSGVEIGGMERAVIRLASRGLREGMDHRLLLFDKPFRSELSDFNPGSLEIHFLQRRPGVDLQFASNLARKLVDLSVDVVHAHNDTAIFYAAVARSTRRLRETALIGTFRNRPTHATWGARLAARWAARRATRIIAVSEELSDWLVRSGWVDRCATIWNGVDLTTFSPIGGTSGWRSKLGIPHDAVLVGHIGRFVPIKRHVDLFDAASKLQGAKPPVYFAFAGSGPLFETFRQRARYNPNIIMLANISCVASFLRSLDIFVLCSAHEGTPQALLEAMACERPIIATQVGGIPQVLDAEGPEPAGRLIAPFRPDQLADEIIRLCRDDALRHRLAILARRRAQAFSFNKEWAQYAALYTAPTA